MGETGGGQAAMQRHEQETGTGGVPCGNCQKRLQKQQVAACLFWDRILSLSQKHTHTKPRTTHAHWQRLGIDPTHLLLGTVSWLAFSQLLQTSYGALCRRPPACNQKLSETWPSTAPLRTLQTFCCRSAAQLINCGHTSLRHCSLLVVEADGHLLHVWQQQV